jgi:hypothetical protein
MDYLIDKRTVAKRQQQELFSLLGTLRRIEMNLSNLEQQPAVADMLYEADVACFSQAALRIRLLSGRIRDKMQNLPNKKRLAAAFGKPT